MIREPLRKPLVRVEWERAYAYAERARAFSEAEPDNECKRLFALYTGARELRARRQLEGAA
jgi:hypothetical protein